ncbi:choline BCCT transporter BetT [Corynebacterium silvaticum]|uniref:Choline BCCT transporter BetT n=1 Tax=Corynebacterium silvaticum TaxID=2320431 RepID=A0A7U5K9L4_9CORY|nr:choline BCCT transporter BetT [Corynebacterium silvaticum]ARU46763.1 choline BCCT transporter BetT [Corynebacterium silvaticum]UWH00004.1 choline BCCT transporter BetT [Corynebacterium silvaticum]UWH02051.1 choline BCCT transporter BetT [Corynebacterium silvaticum]UWH04088.1 choline BCCT transporter BetT [Corynebacterium silvaticum]UXZ26251.1 choline BCCT transporter BetT [Corynebacterium silvaticum]
MPNTALGDESGNDSPPVNGGKVLVGSYNVGTSGVPPARTNWPVFLASAAGILAVTLWAFIGRESAEKALGSITTWIATNFGWFYILTATVVIVFILGVAFSGAGKIRLGPDHSRPQFKLFSWSAMLFAAGIGVDLMFFSVAEPVAQYYGPPVGSGESREAAKEAVVWALFHYGFTGWAMYSLMGMAFGYYAYRLNMPLAIRSALYPLVGKRIHGPIGDSVDVSAMLGTVFGIAASLGIGVVQLNYGIKVLFGVEEGATWQIILVVVSVAIATLSAVSGVDKGIKMLSEINVLLAIALMVYVVVAGKTAFLLDGLVMNIGDYVASLPGMTMDTYAFTDDPEHTKAWLGAWTLFFWAWWVAWAPFVGLFLARISRGRTLRQFVFGTLSVPFLFILLWMSFFGNSALDIVRGGNDEFGHAAAEEPQRGFYDLLATYPGATAIIALATLIGLLLYITSADSGALVMSNFTSTTTHSSQDGPVWSRIFWAVLVGALTVVLLQIDGVSTVQSATVVMRLPFTVVMYLIMLGLVRSFRLERAQVDARTISMHGAMSGRSSDGSTWRRRLSRANTWPSTAKTQRFLEEMATPALKQVAQELCDRGLDASLVATDVPESPVGSLDLTVDLGDEQNFRYQLFAVSNPVPSFTKNPGKEHYYRIEVFDLTGSLGYDVFGYTGEQLIDNVLDLYERHLDFLHMQKDLPGSSDLSDGAQPVRFWREDH